MHTLPNRPPPLTSAQLMAYLQISRTTFDTLAPTLPGRFKVGREWRFDVEAIERWQREGGSAREERQGERQSGRRSA
jgi:predicted DNA-binding transcriptional regulator AlpA